MGTTICSSGCSLRSISKYTRTVKGFRYTCAAAASFGLESVVRAEIERLGISVPRVEDRRVLFDATAQEIARCNIHLRAADRILIQVGEFPAPDFDALYEGIRALPWRELLAPSPAVSVDARSVKSKLTALPSVQSVAKKAIMDALAGAKRRSRAVRERSPAWMPETGPRYDVQVSLHQDRASVSLDTTGPGLHKRGYRRHVGEAPLRENLAAALVLLSRWDVSRPLADTVCGSGTIAIEAALQAANIAPGNHRRFSAEDWPLFPESLWREERAAARDRQALDVRASICASDRDPGMVRAASANAAAAGVGQLIQFRTAPLESFTSDQEFGCLVCNPPYGERLGDAHDADDLARSMGSLWRTLPTWSFFVLSALEDFERSFGARAARNRKLYNGNIRCWYYQYFGPLPRGRADEASRDQAAPG
jgi:putative N6-adenine-specific DNA methylase